MIKKKSHDQPSLAEKNSNKIEPPSLLYHFNKSIKELNPITLPF